MTAHKDGFWEPRRVEILKRRHIDDRLSSAQIAEELGCTRNAVIGKIGRLGLEGHGKAAVAPRKPRIRVRQQPICGRSVEPVDFVEMPPPSIEDAARDRASLKTLMELEAGACKWPIDNPDGGFLFCSSPVLDDRPYCGAHCRRAYNPGAYRNALRPYQPQRVTK